MSTLGLVLDLDTASRAWQLIEPRLDADRTADECWIWPGSGTPCNYGQVFPYRSNVKRAVYVHRASWVVATSLVIPEGMQIDHLCHDPKECTERRSCPHRRCCNPAHLALVTLVQNLARSTSPSALNAVKVKCKHGHTAWTLLRSGARSCRECHRLDMQERRLRVRTGA